MDNITQAGEKDNPLTVTCKYNGEIDCTVEEIREGRCAKCGWRPRFCWKETPDGILTSRTTRILPEELYDRLVSGEQVKTIAASAHVRHSTIVAMRTRLWPGEIFPSSGKKQRTMALKKKITEEELRELSKTMTNEQIAEHYDISLSAVYDLKKKLMPGERDSRGRKGGGENGKRDMP